MTIEDYAMELCSGEIDIDVTDTEIDLWVAYVYNFNEVPSDNYEKFLEFLGINVNVVRQNRDTLNCDFTGFARKNISKVKKFLDTCYDRNSFEFDDDEDEFNFVVALDGLIAGYGTEEDYGEFLRIFKR